MKRIILGGLLLATLARGQVQTPNGCNYCLEVQGLCTDMICPTPPVGWKVVDQVVKDGDRTFVVRYRVDKREARLVTHGWSQAVHYRADVTVYELRPFQTEVGGKRHTQLVLWTIWRPVSSDWTVEPCLDHTPEELVAQALEREGGRKPEVEPAPAPKKGKKSSSKYKIK